MKKQKMLSVRYMMLGLGIIPFAVACGATQGEEVLFEQSRDALTQPLLSHRSLVASETAIAQSFSLESVLQALLNDAGDTTQSPLQFWTTWQSSHNSCADLNGSPLTCRPGDANDLDPFSTGSFGYRALALFNRFDLAPADGANCGEYRIVFDREANQFLTQKTVIFENSYPNPKPAEGLNGCKAVTKFWADLSAIDSVTERATRLHAFFFDGIDGLAPALKVANLGQGSHGGQIRTNSFLDLSEWSMREYHLSTDCTGPCQLKAVQAPVSDTPLPSLSHSAATNARALDFQDWFISALEPSSGLFANSIAEIQFTVPTRFLAAEAILPDRRGAPSIIENIHDDADAPFRTRITEKLTAIGSQLSAAQVLARASSATCAGCHRASIGDDLGFASVFPDVNAFRHVKVSLDSSAPDGPRHALSAALHNEFLPKRLAKFESFLAQLPQDILTATIRIDSEWPSGYCAAVTVSNHGTAASTWNLVLSLNGSTLSNSWSVSQLSAAPPTFSGPSWAANIAASGSANFGFCANKTAGESAAVTVVSLVP